MIRNIAIAALGFSPICPHPVPPPHIEPVRPPQVIHLGEDQRFQFDARPGDTIILTMNPTGNIQERCNDAGGELIFNPYSIIFTCEKVDF